MATRTDFLQMAIACQVAAAEAKDKESMKKAALIKELVESLPEEIVQDGQRRFRASEYGYIRFAKVICNTQKNPVNNVLRELTLAGSRLLLMLMTISMSNLFAVSKADMAEIANLNIRSVRKAIKELCDLHVIMLVSRETNRAPAIYEWDHHFVRIGKDDGDSDYDYSPGDECLDALIAKMKVPPDYLTTRKKLFLAGKEREDFVSFVERNKW